VGPGTKRQAPSTKHQAPSTPTTTNTPTQPQQAPNQHHARIHFGACPGVFCFVGDKEGVNNSLLCGIRAYGVHCAAAIGFGNEEVEK